MLIKINIIRPHPYRSKMYLGGVNTYAVKYKFLQQFLLHSINVWFQLPLKVLKIELTMQWNYLVYSNVQFSIKCGVWYSESKNKYKHFTSFLVFQSKWLKQKHQSVCLVYSFFFNQPKWKYYAISNFSFFFSFFHIFVSFHFYNGNKDVSATKMMKEFSEIVIIVTCQKQSNSFHFDNQIDQDKENLVIISLCIVLPNHSFEPIRYPHQ